MTDSAVMPSIALGPEEGEILTFLGGKVVFKSPSAGTGDWTVLDYTLPARQLGAPLHYHNELVETFYVLSGELWMRVGNEEINAGPGSFVLVNPGTVHSFANRTDSPARFLAHASSARHKEFLRELFAMANAEEAWPPRDPAPYVELGKRYDSVYLAV